jgi:hypothetical protein
MNNTTSMRWISLLVAGTLLAGCATPPGGGTTGAADDSDPCSVGKTAAVGALVGALVGAAINGKNGAMAGAALGGLAGGAGCYAINVRSRQLKTAAQSDQEYVRARGALPPEPRVVSYNAAIDSKIVERGKPFHVVSNVELVNGRQQQIKEVSEELVLLDTEGKPIKNGSKPLVSKNSSAGQFENSFELKLPEGVSQGVYPLKTNLYVNGKMVASRDLRAQLVIRDGAAMVVASR